MAANILKAGHSHTVDDIKREAAESLLEYGAVWAGTPKDVAAADEMIFTSLPGPKEVESVALGAKGILEGIQPGSVYVDLTTNSPEWYVRYMTDLKKRAFRLNKSWLHRAISWANPFITI